MISRHFTHGLKLKEWPSQGNRKNNIRGNELVLVEQKQWLMRYLSEKIVDGFQRGSCFLFRNVYCNFHIVWGKSTIIFSYVILCLTFFMFYDYISFSTHSLNFGYGQIHKDLQNSVGFKPHGVFLRTLPYFIEWPFKSKQYICTVIADCSFLVLSVF